MNQLSIFLENKPGELTQLTQILSDVKVSIDSIMIAETSSFGVVRLITKDYERAMNELKSAGFSVRVIKVIGVLMQNEVGAFHKIVELLSKNSININYCYSFYSGDNKGVFVFSVDKVELAKELLEKVEFHLVEYV
ncbi:ACT domain-containing protein [Campylobacter geochelonis]|uniref:Acetolactate synthase 3 regulatory subunit n=1 Tax=Campylobacter geochelonis TaxID=1780362 RepID=A0A128EJ08_9BACT|nr:ACT domain-containing protein [Campylobacter geochelonis]QKF71154.1 ACT domain-containing protein [Campylobacter geochelonis]CZE48551.1 acetolactate synthase 3 regulatory subunit [Campylobacter geochelonis]CZE50037.1 acetolactate synthase 3 regulatory subunit [Campylobacter geochelonis]